MAILVYTSKYDKESDNLPQDEFIKKRSILIDDYNFYFNKLHYFNNLKNIVTNNKAKNGFYYYPAGTEFRIRKPLFFGNWRVKMMMNNMIKFCENKLQKIKNELKLITTLEAEN